MGKFLNHLSDAVATFAVTLVLVPAILGQGDKADSVKVSTNLLVLDEKDQYVDNLKSSDIKIFEGGIEQPVTSFVALTGGADIIIVADNSGSVRQQLKDITDVG